MLFNIYNGKICKYDTVVSVYICIDISFVRYILFCIEKDKCNKKGVFLQPEKS